MSCLCFLNQRLQQCGGFWVHVKRESSDEPWGLQTLHSDQADGLVIKRVLDTGAIAKWNWTNPEDQVACHHAIVSVNGRTNIQEKMDELRYAKTLKMEVSLRLSREETMLARRHYQFKDKFRERLVKVDAALKDMGEASDSPDGCPVCLDDLGQEVLRLPCGHRFHRSCISKWLAGPVSPTCPSCKQQLTIPGLDNDRHVDTSQVQVTNM
ncbi:unnamed protein product [Cladocopium goreaui]|uniref:E3 ubiquitin-protein ligase ARK2C (Arkadia-lik e protein 2C) (Ark2C) (RING finger protein 165) n=1 Tax=Cladocopium goreaui TaxID=2562237 RepID=A0A9P1BKL9_9DINO|nr:unnamed protein product [Cladocopium goreaui]